MEALSSLLKSTKLSPQEPQPSTTPQPEHPGTRARSPSLESISTNSSEWSMVEPVSPQPSFARGNEDPKKRFGRPVMPKSAEDMLNTDLRDISSMIATHPTYPLLSMVAGEVSSMIARPLTYPDTDMIPYCADKLGECSYCASPRHNMRDCPENPGGATQKVLRILKKQTQVRGVRKDQDVVGESVTAYPSSQETPLQQMDGTSDAQNKVHEVPKDQETITGSMKANTSSQEAPLPPTSDITAPHEVKKPVRVKAMCGCSYCLKNVHEAGNCFRDLVVSDRLMEVQCQLLDRSVDRQSKDREVPKDQETGSGSKTAHPSSQRAPLPPTSEPEVPHEGNDPVSIQKRCWCSYCMQGTHETGNCVRDPAAFESFMNHVQARRQQWTLEDQNKARGVPKYQEIAPGSAKPHHSPEGNPLLQGSGPGAVVKAADVPGRETEKPVLINNLGPRMSVKRQASSEDTHSGKRIAKKTDEDQRGSPAWVEPVNMSITSDKTQTKEKSQMSGQNDTVMDAQQGIAKRLSAVPGGEALHEYRRRDPPRNMPSIVLKKDSPKSGQDSTQMFADGMISDNKRDVKISDVPRYYRLRDPALTQQAIVDKGKTSIKEKMRRFGQINTQMLADCLFTEKKDAQTFDVPRENQRRDPALTTVQPLVRQYGNDQGEHTHRAASELTAYDIEAISPSIGRNRAVLVRAEGESRHPHHPHQPTLIRNNNDRYRPESFNPDAYGNPARASRALQRGRSQPPQVYPPPQPHRVHDRPYHRRPRPEKLSIDYILHREESPGKDGAS